MDDLQGCWVIDSVTNYIDGYTITHSQNEREVKFMSFNEYSQVVFFNRDSVLVTSNFEMKNDTICVPAQYNFNQPFTESIDCVKDEEEKFIDIPKCPNGRLFYLFKWYFSPVSFGKDKLVLKTSDISSNSKTLINTFYLTKSTKKRVEDFLFKKNVAETNKQISVTDSLANNLNHSLVSGDTKVFEGEKDGLRFSIKYPKELVSLPGDKPNTVRKFAAENSEGKVFRCVVFVMDLKAGESSREEQRKSFQPEKMRDVLEKGAKQIGFEFEYLKGISDLEIDGEPACAIEYFNKIKEYSEGKDVTSICRAYAFGYKSFLIHVTFYLDDLNNDKTRLKQLFPDYEFAMNTMVNSFTIESKWEK